MGAYTCLMAALMTAGLVACSKANAGDNGSPTMLQPTAPAVLPAPTPIAEPQPIVAPKAAIRVDLELATVANTMTYDKIAMTAPTGAEVHLTLKNNATMATLPHNWALVKPGTEASVAAAGLKVGERAGYLDASDSNVLVHSPMAKPGESVETTFVAPEPGKYPYICTVPGHYMMMKGVLTVTP
ncbi:MAG: plastocyanin/azurin family copper-binding protein [Polyangiaceae bacterium]|jgi:azurin